LNSLPRQLLEIQTTPCHRHPAIIAALEPNLGVTMARVAETSKTDIDEMIHWTDLKQVNLLHCENTYLTHKDLNTSLAESEHRLNIYLVLYNIFTPRSEPSRNDWLSYYAWSFGIFDESYRYKTENSVGWQIAINVHIGFKLQVTVTPEFHSLHDRCYQTMWPIPGVPDDPANETVMAQHGADWSHSAVQNLMHAIQTEDEDVQQDTAHRMIHSAKPSTIRMWSELKLAKGKWLGHIPTDYTHLI
jgi:hypothetical protein